MRISQRGDFSTDGTHGFTANDYTVDRWRLNSDGAGTDYIQHVSDNQPDGLYNTKSLKMTVKSTDTKYRRICQGIEDYKQFVEGRVMTISFYYKAQNVSGQLKVGQWINNNSTSFYNKIADLPSTNTWVKKEITFTVHKTSANFTYHPDINFGFCDDGGASVAGVIDDYVEVTGVQLEEGPVATPFEHRPYGLELSLCQRYFEKSYNNTVAPGSATYEGAVVFIANRNPGLPHYALRFITQKRTAPAVTIYNPNDGTSNEIRNVDDNLDISPVVSRLGDVGATIYSHTSTALGKFLAFHYTADAEL
jgi:hypothetical protein